MSPEVLQPDCEYAKAGATAALDIWGAGCFLYYLLAEEDLFGESGDDCESARLKEQVSQQQAAWVRLSFLFNATPDLELGSVCQRWLRV